MKLFDKILFANDFSENSEHAFDYALTLARNSKLISSLSMSSMNRSICVVSTSLISPSRNWKRRSRKGRKR